MRNEVWIKLGIYVLLVVRSPTLGGLCSTAFDVETLLLESGLPAEALSKILCPQSALLPAQKTGTNTQQGYKRHSHLCWKHRPEAAKRQLGRNARTADSQSSQRHSERKIFQANPFPSLWRLYVVWPIASFEEIPESSCLVSPASSWDVPPVHGSKKWSLQIRRFWHEALQVF